MKFSYILPYRHHPSRISNLEATLDWVSSMNCEIILVEDGQFSYLDKIKDKYKLNYTFIKNDLPFNKSWIFNIGLSKSTKDIVVFGDSDLIMDTGSILDSISKIDQYDCVNPYSSVIDLSPEETSIYLKDRDMGYLNSIKRPGRGEFDIQKVPLCGGIVIFTREGINRINGWCELFQGWGGEDDFQSMKVKHELNFYEDSFKCYHLYHERIYPNMDLYQSNLSILNYASSQPKQAIISNFGYNHIGDQFPNVLR